MSTIPHLAIEVDEDALIALCRRHHIRKLQVFGSVLRSDFEADSDVDLLVEFEQGHTPGWEIVDIGEDFSAIFHGRYVELIDPDSLHRYIKDRVLNDARLLFEAENAT